MPSRSPPAADEMPPRGDHGDEKADAGRGRNVHPGNRVQSASGCLRKVLRARGWLPAAVTPEVLQWLSTGKAATSRPRPRQRPGRRGRPRIARAPKEALAQPTLADDGASYRQSRIPAKEAPALAGRRGRQRRKSPPPPYVVGRGLKEPGSAGAGHGDSE
jgi:hypothetical protein